MSKLRFVEQSVLKRLDLFCLVLSLLYLFFYFFSGADRKTVTLQPFFFIAPLTYFIYLSKKRNKVVYSALAYAYFSITLISVLDLEIRSYFFLIPLLVFVIIMVAEIKAHFLSGIIYGYWILFIYFFYQNYQTHREFLSSLYYSIADLHFEEIFDHLIFILIIGMIFALVGKKEDFSFNGYWIEKVDYTLFLFSLGYLYIWISGGYTPEKLTVMLLYIFISYATLAGKNKESNLFCAISNTGVAFIICYGLKLNFQIENFYFLLLIPLLILLIVSYLKYHNYFATGFILAYWVIIMYKTIQEKVNFADWNNMIEFMFSYQMVVTPLNNIVLLIIAGIIFGNLAKLGSNFTMEKSISL